MNSSKIEKFLIDNNYPNFRLKQIKKSIFQDGIFSFSEMNLLPKDLREKLQQEIKILSFDVEKIMEDKKQESAKALLRLKDGKLIETVLMRFARNASLSDVSGSVCVSSQVGCPMNCGFCATGQGGFKRNLTSEEITDQVLFWIGYLKKTNGKISNIVYMGMGEPFLNWEEVEKSLIDLIDKNLFGFGSRSISVSTAGIPEGIKNLAEKFPQVNLALSLHFADDKKRSKFMPINNKYNLESLRDSLKKYFLKTKRKVFIEYIMLNGINDTPEDAKILADYLRSIGNSYLLHVNLIRYNATDSKLGSSSKNKTQEFKDFLLKNHISVTIRKSLGEEIQGACGQLAGK